MVYVGLISFTLAFAALLAAMLIAIAALVRKQNALPSAARLLGQLSFGLHTLSLLTLVLLQVLEDYSFTYVSLVINPAMPLVLKITALWGGQTGSLFFWGWILSLCMFIALSSHKHLLDNWAFLVVAVNLLIYSALSLFIDNPFSRVWLLTDNTLVDQVFRPAAGAQVYGLLTGQGLNPLLRHPGMIIHPPLLYFGYALFQVPFATAVSRLIRGEISDKLLTQTRAWIITAWMLLSAGIVLGSWWSYDVLGWGGYWAWDPVETASLLPWLASTALLHNLLLERKRHIFQRFNLILVLLSYLLVIFSIFVTRSGLVSSVHAFGESTIAVPLMVLLFASLLTSIVLLALRWKAMASAWEFNSPFSREALVLYTNIVLLALLLICLWGLVFPFVNGLFSAQQVSLDIAYYRRTTTPLFVLLVFLLALCPLAGWNVTQIKKLGKQALLPTVAALLLVGGLYLAGIKQIWALVGIFLAALGLFNLLYLTLRDAFAVGFKRFWKLAWLQRARYGAWLVHAGILMIALGITGVEQLATSIQGTMVPGEKMPLGQYEIEFVSVERDWNNPEYLSVTADTRLYRDGVLIAELNPGQDVYMDRGQYISIPDAHSTLRGDFYTLLIGYDVDIPYITLRAADNPLVNFMWIGGIFLVLGGAVAVSLPAKAGGKEEEALEA